MIEPSSVAEPSARADRVEDVRWESQQRKKARKEAREHEEQRSLTRKYMALTRSNTVERMTRRRPSELVASGRTRTRKKIEKGKKRLGGKKKKKKPEEEEGGEDTLNLALDAPTQEVMEGSKQKGRKE